MYNTTSVADVKAALVAIEKSTERLVLPDGEWRWLRAALCSINAFLQHHDTLDEYDPHQAIASQVSSFPMELSEWLCAHPYNVQYLIDMIREEGLPDDDGEVLAQAQYRAVAEFFNVTLRRVDELLGSASSESRGRGDGVRGATARRTRGQA